MFMCFLLLTHFHNYFSNADKERQVSFRSDLVAAIFNRMAEEPVQPLQIQLQSDV